MTTDKTEIYKQFMFQLVRYVFVATGSWLVKKGVIDSEVASGVSSNDAILGIVGLFTLAVPVVWGWAKARFNVKFARAAHQADSGTPLSAVKAEVLANENKVISV